MDWDGGADIDKCDTKWVKVSMNKPTQVRKCTQTHTYICDAHHGLKMANQQRYVGVLLMILNAPDKTGYWDHCDNVSNFVQCLSHFYRLCWNNGL